MESKWVKFCRENYEARQGKREEKKIKGRDLDRMTREEIDAWIAQNISKDTEEL